MVANLDTERIYQEVQSPPTSSEDEEVESHQSEEEEDQVEIDPEEELRAFKDPEPHSKEWKNRQRVLLLCQRGINGRFMHLMEDITLLIAHSKRENKIERKRVKEQIDAICYERSCNNFIYLEQR